ncbi:hypothetical protein D9M68_778510 [compost metagenome]
MLARERITIWLAKDKAHPSTSKSPKRILKSCAVRNASPSVAIKAPSTCWTEECIPRKKKVMGSVKMTARPVIKLAFEGEVNLSPSVWSATAANSANPAATPPVNSRRLMSFKEGNSISAMTAAATRKRRAVKVAEFMEASAS